VSTERWNRLEDVFAEALALPASQRSAFVERACGDDAELRSDLDGLLVAHESSGVLDVAPRAASPAPQPSLASGARLGPWRIERLIGRGGMGEVYAATRADAAFDQLAALKLLRHEAVGQLERFHAERRILGSLEHPGIARLLDGGMAGDGRPFTVMEYVEGQSLTKYCSAHHATLLERLALFTQVCDAVAFAHRNLIIHRDLKPDNILVNAEGRVKLLDFGIAKLLDAAALPVEGSLTLAPFTPDYAAPEQLSGEAVTTAADIYALGVLLFELLTGERLVRTRGLPSTQALQRLSTRDAPPPSRIAQSSPDAPLPARRLAGDLDAIVAKCLRKEPVHRYETVNALKHDLERHLRNEPVLARSGARAYIARRFVRRHWLPIAGVSVLILAMGAAAIYANDARRHTEQALHRADVVRDFVIDLFRQNDPRAGNSKTMSARELVDLGARRVESGFGDDADTRIELLGVTGNLYDSLGEFQRSGELLARRLDQATQAYAPDDPRRIEAQLDMAQAQSNSEHFDAAQALLEQALSRATPERVELLPQRARLLLALSNLQANRGNYQKAIEWALQAIDLLKRLPGATASQRATALSDYGLFVFRSGRIADAEQPLREALDQLKGDEQDNLSTLLAVRLSLGQVLTSLGRFDEAGPLLSANAASIRQLYGDQHPRLADALHQLGAVKRQSGDAKSAVPIFQEALAIYESKFGPDHSFTATALTSLGQALSADGQHEQGIDALARAHAIYLKTLGPAHAYTATSATALADARLAAGDLQGAEAGFRAALQTFDNVDDGKHIYAEAARLGLGHALAAEHRYDEAEVPLRQAKARFVKEFGADDRRAIDAALTLVHCLLQSGHRDDAQTLLEESERALATSTRDVKRSRARVEKVRREFDGT
jgi:predicted negative regulator of RcsB-dependent stress response/predicted Ser/Thr protein kinase